MKLLSATMCLITLFAAPLGAARADAGADAPLLAALAKANQVCKDNAQKSKTELQSKLAHSPDMPPAQRAQLTETVKDLDRVITTTTAVLNDPAIKTGGLDPKQLATRLYNVTQLSNSVLSTAQRELGVAPTSRAEEIRAKQMQMVNSDPSLKLRFSHAWDGLASSSNDDRNFAGAGSGSNFFSEDGTTSAPVVVVSAYKPTTAQTAAKVVGRYGGTPGGVALEGSANGLGPVKTVKYDPRYNALVMDNQLVYFIRMPPWDAAALCREIGRDNKNDDPKDKHEGERVAVSMGSVPKENIVFGAPSTYQDTDIAHDLFLTDGFLANVVFGPYGVYDWSVGYRFPNGYEPRRIDHFAHMLVYFTFRNFTFKTNGGALDLANESLDVTLMPIGTDRAPSGAFLPDYKVLETGWAPPPAFVANANYLTSHLDYFRRERLIAKAFAYGELAAVFRSYKEAGIDLPALAADFTSAVTRGG